MKLQIEALQEALHLTDIYLCGYEGAYEAYVEISGLSDAAMESGTKMANEFQMSLSEMRESGAGKEEIDAATSDFQNRLMSIGEVEISESTLKFLNDSIQSEISKIDSGESKVMNISKQLHPMRKLLGVIIYTK